MLLKANPLVPVAISGAGVMLGVFVFLDLIPSKIKEVLEVRDKKTLDLEGDEESWLILAQQYRENGAVIPGEDRDFRKQWDPGFLSKQNWLSSVRQIIEGNNTSKNEFERDEKIANLLRQKCRESLNSNYTKTLYSDVLKWCTLDLPDYAKEILKFQKQGGDCRFWLVNVEHKGIGQFVWEAIDVGAISKHQLLMLKLVLQEKPLSKSFLRFNEEAKKEAKKIMDECAKKKHQYLELSFRSYTGNSPQKIWKFSPNWNKGYKAPVAEQKA